MKCWVLLLNRNRGKLFKKASYEACSGKIRKRFRENLGFFIPDDSIPIEVEKSRGSTIPMWVVNEKTDVDAHTKLNLLSKKEFWKQVAEKIKLSKMETFVYLCAGYGLIRMIEYFLMLVFTPH